MSDSPIPSAMPLYGLKEDVPKFLGISERQVARLINDPTCPLKVTHLVGARGRRVSEANLAAYVESCRIAPDTPAQAEPKPKAIKIAPAEIVS